MLFFEWMLNYSSQKIHGQLLQKQNGMIWGSRTVDEDLLHAANLLENETVQVATINNGSIETCITKIEKGLAYAV